MIGVVLFENLTGTESKVCPQDGQTAHTRDSVDSGQAALSTHRTSPVQSGLCDKEVAVRSVKLGIRIALAAVMVLMAAANASAFDYLIEAETGGQHQSQYSESAGTGWNHTSAHSGGETPTEVSPALPTTTAGIGSRYTNNIAAIGTFTYTPIESGQYEVFVTWGTSGYGDTSVTYALNYEGGTQVQMYNQAPGNGNGIWQPVGALGSKYQMNAGTSYTLVATNPAVNGNGRLMCDAVVFRKPGCGDVAAVTVNVPVIVGDTMVRVGGGLSVEATKVSVYADGVKIGEKLLPGDPDVIVPPLVPGVHINATQTVGGNEGCILQDGPIPSDRSYLPGVAVAGAYIPPGNADFAPVLLAGDTKIRVSGVRSDATAVTVYANGASIGTNTAPGGAADVDVTVAALVTGHIVSATQTLPSFSQPGVALESAVPIPGPVVDSPDQVPVVRVVGMVDAGRTEVRVTGVSGCATLVTVHDETAATDIGTNNSPTGGTTLVAVPGLVEGHVIKARQTIRIDGALSDGRRVKATNVIEDFTDAPAIAGDPPMTGGAYQTWYPVNTFGYCVSTISTSTLFGSQCLRVDDNGWTNGAYAIYEQIVPVAAGPGNQHHLTIEMLVDEAGCGDPDWMETYQVGVIVNGTHRPAAGTIAPCTLIGQYDGPLTPNVDGTDATQAVLVYGATFVAEPGDDLLIAFSTNASTYARNRTNTSPFSAMKIDNIKIQGMPRCLPCDVAPVTVGVASAGDLLVARETEVMVTGCDVTALMVNVYEYTASPEAWMLIGSSPGCGIVTTTPLVAHKTIVATQTLTPSGCLDPIEGIKPTSGPVVGTNRNSAVRITLGARETNSPEPCAIGTDGGTVGAIEWIGSTTAGLAPIGKLVEPSMSWQTITFDPRSDPIRSFNVGNGVLDGACGVLECLGITATGGNTGKYTLYIDNVYSGTTLIEDFEDPTYIAGSTQALFRSPRASGTTGSSTNLLTYPNVSVVSNEKFDTGTQSAKVQFQFYNESTSRWLRLTTFGLTAPEVMPKQNPIIDFAQPITLRLLLIGADCGTLFADADTDGDVDQADFAAFQACFTGPGGTASEACGCFDRDDDSDVDSDDAYQFDACASGPGVAALPAVNPYCEP